MSRCGVIPPHLLQHLSQSSNSERAAAAEATLLLDARHRAARVEIHVPHHATVTAESDDASQSDGSGTPGDSGDKPAASHLKRTIHDSEHTEDLPGKKIRDEGQPENKDEAVNHAYDHLGATYKLFHDVYGRDSLDGRGMPLIASVHYGDHYDNAFWDGKQMAFGDGDGDVFKDFTGCLDVIAHELTHGVTERTAKLEYIGQAGALNEHVSDAFGVLAVQYAAKQTADEATWLIGDGLFTDSVEGKALRSMKAPGTAYDDDVLGKDPQPAHMDHFVDTFEDNGGVHINSGIPNHAFYLAATEIGQNAWEGAGKIWYETLTGGKLKSDATFAEFAKLTAATAVELFGEGSKEVKAVNAAWEGVGVPLG
jgi:Zn-dependent metalloprotease